MICFHCSPGCCSSPSFSKSVLPIFITVTSHIFLLFVFILVLFYLLFLKRSPVEPTELVTRRVLFYRSPKRPQTKCVHMHYSAHRYIMYLSSSARFPYPLASPFHTVYPLNSYYTKSADIATSVSPLAGAYTGFFSQDTSGLSYATLAMPRGICIIAGDCLFLYSDGDCILNRRRYLPSVLVGIRLGNSSVSLFPIHMQMTIVPRSGKRNQEKGS